MIWTKSWQGFDPNHDKVLNQILIRIWSKSGQEFVLPFYSVGLRKKKCQAFAPGKSNKRFHYPAWHSRFVFVIPSTAALFFFGERERQGKLKPADAFNLSFSFMAVAWILTPWNEKVPSLCQESYGKSFCFYLVHLPTNGNDEIIFRMATRRRSFSFRRGTVCTVINSLKLFLQLFNCESTFYTVIKHFTGDFCKRVYMTRIFNCKSEAKVIV